VKKKDTEIQQLQKAIIRDSIRISYFELGRIHYQFGFLSEAVKAWCRSLDYATQEEDLFNVTYHLAQAAFENQSPIYLTKYAGEAEARERTLGKQTNKTMQVKVLDALSSLQSDNLKDAAIRMANNIQVTDESALTEFVRAKDLAFYIVICSLHSLNRKEIKTHILSAPGYKALMESTNDGGSINLSDVIENFLNGRYMDYQSQINEIARQMKFDVYFGHRLGRVMKNIRKKALIQYVTPYKVIDMREIQKAFGIPLEQIETEIAELIIQKQI
jgi:COP9 signalosome complex subunit 1